MKIFVLLSRFPYPLEKGDKLRAFNQIKQLSAHHEIHLCALNDIVIKKEFKLAVQPYCKSVHILNLSRITVVWNIIRAFFSGKPLQVGYFYNYPFQKKVNKLIHEIEPDHIYCQLLRVAEYVRKVKIPKTLDYQDVFSYGVKRRLKTAPFYLKPLLRMEYKRLCKYEAGLFGDFDHKTIISYPDRDLIPHPEKEKIVVIPNGVDIGFFKPVEAPKKYDLIFTGNMGYPPNINAAIFLSKKILPIVHQTLPNTSLVLAGASPHTQVIELKGEKIEVTGWVDDIREYYATARIFIAPMQIGTGLQNKLLEAMAMKIPCITSPLANSALGAKANTEIMVGETAEDFAKIIIELMNNHQKACELADNGYRFVISTFNWESATAKLERLINKD